MSNLSGSAHPSALVDALLRLSPAGIILYRPLPDAAGHLVDFAFVQLNEAAKQRLHLPERPAGTLLTQHPRAAADGVLACYSAAYATGAQQQCDADFAPDGVPVCLRLTAQRCDDLLVVSFTDCPLQNGTTAAPTRRARQQQERATRRAAEAPYAALEQVLDQAPALLCVLSGPELMVEFTNATYQSLMGGRQLQGKPIGETLPELQDQGYLELLRRVYHTGELVQAAEHPATLDFSQTGCVETRYFTFSYQARRDAAGCVDGVIVLGYDVTEQVRARQQVQELNQHLIHTNQELEARVQERTYALQLARAEAESQRARLERLFRAAPAIVNTNLGPDHVFELVHPLTDRLFGFRPLAGRPIREALPDMQGDFFALMDKVYRTGQPYHGHSVAVRFGEPTDGPLTEAYFDFTYQPLPGPDGMVEGVMTFAVDVTEQVRARQLAEQNEARFRHLAETAPMIVWEADAAGHTTYLSPLWQHLTASGHASSSPWYEHLHPDDRDAVLQDWQRALRTQQPFQHELRLRLATGEYRWFLDRAVPVRDAGGQLVQWVGAAADIDAQKQAQHALQTSQTYFRQMADLVPTLIWQTDADGACVYLNASWYDYTGQEPAQALGFGWQAAVHPGVLPGVAAVALPAVANQQPFTVVYRLRRRDGRYRWVTDSGRPRFDARGGMVGYLGSVTDIHEQKRVEQVLQRRTAELRTARDQAQLLNTELAARNEQLQRLNVELDTFVYMASHDLRAPLLNIEGLVQALQEDLPLATLPPAAAHLVQLLHESTERFKEILDHLMEVARAQQQPAAHVPVDLVSLVREVQLDLQPLIRDTRAHIELGLLECPTVPLAPTYARSVVYNLLSNALKYHHPERPPHVRIGCHTEEHHVVLTVEDNGLGLTQEGQREAFAPFHRLHDHVEGSGVGLYMIKRLVENAGGRIQVESQLGIGTTFRVYFRR